MQSQTVVCRGFDGGSDERFRRRCQTSAARVPPQVTPAIVNALIGAADDPEPVVRAAAFKALGTIGDRERALAPVLARLVDQTRVVRARAAEVLVTFGIVELPGNAGEALRRAQEEYIVSLDTFPDVASNHAAKGWLEAERGNTVQALAALEQGDRGRAALCVSVGGQGRAVGAARAGLPRRWRCGRRPDRAGYPNIDQLIAEASRSARSGLEAGDRRDRA